MSQNSETRVLSTVAVNDASSIPVSIETINEMAEQLFRLTKQAGIPALIWILEDEVTAETIHLMAEQLTQFAANRAGLVVTIERRSLQPFAMGHAEYVIETRPAREVKGA